MPSISDFEYDIFISYRQKDNRGEHWVTEFVEALKSELDATFKEDISIYFDENPHDGLLETHDVDGSLKEKVRSLIFIPIVSQTYCDPKSFAWQKEFLAFIDFARKDQFGLDVRLMNGNMAKRVLPVRIHEVEEADKKLFEEAAGSTMRSIDFIFKSAGVNRPLRSIEEHPHDNVNKTFYRDQINKTANAVKELIYGLKNFNNIDSSKTADSINQKPVATKKFRIVFASLFVLIAVALAYFFPQLKKGDSKESNSIAVLAFKDLSEKGDQEWFSDGLSDEILNRLANLQQLKVTARTSSFYFKDKSHTVKEIAQKLDVENILEGSVQRVGNQLRITAQLIRAKDEAHIWSRSYDRLADNLFQVQTEIAQDIANSLLTNLSKKDLQELNSNNTSNTQAYESYLKGIFFHEQLKNTFDSDNFYKSEKEFKQAIELDPSFVDAYGELANLYDTRGETKWKERDSLLEFGFRIKRNSISFLRVKVYMFTVSTHTPNLDSAFFYLKQLLKINPNDSRAFRPAGLFYRLCGMLDVSEAYCLKLLQTDPLSLSSYNQLAEVQLFKGDLDRLYKYSSKALELDPDNLQANGFHLSYYVTKRDTVGITKALRTLSRPGQQQFVLDILKPLVTYLNGDLNKALSEKPTNDIKYAIHFLARSPNHQLLDVLKSMVSEGAPLSSLELINSPAYQSLQNEEEFKKIVNERKKVEEEYRRKYTSLE